MSQARLLSARLITTFGLGHCRPASGTWGSLPPVVWAGVLVLIAGLTPLDTAVAWVYHLSLWVAMLAFGWSVIAGGDRAEAVFGHDPHEVVADETCGQCIPLLLIPPSLIHGQPWWMAIVALGLAFLLFRGLDIAKPWPCNVLQRVPGGWGILLDDVVAGLYAAAALWAITLIM